MAENVISDEVAQKQLDSLLEYYDIDMNDFENDTQKDGLKTACKKLKKAIRKGLLEIKEEEDSLIVYQHLNKPIDGVKNPIKYREIDGRCKIAMKESKDGDHYGKLYSLMGGLSGEGYQVMMRFKGIDLSVMECLGSLFLNV